ncbi:MAG: putative RDD family membrane protein YckC [Planctomycetota bacterium]
MEELVLETPEGLTLRHELAGAGSRTAAGLLDLTLFVVVCIGLALLVTVFSTVGADSIADVLWGFLAGGVVVFFVTWMTLLPLIWDGRTPGKRVMGLRVVDRRGWPASFGQHFLRALLLPLEIFLVVPLPPGIIAMAVLPDCQRLGDLVAGTVCLREAHAQPARMRSAAEPFRGSTWGDLPERKLNLAPALRERFGGPDLAFLRELFLRTEIDSGERHKLYLRAWEHYGAVLGEERVGGISPEQSARNLRELYLFLRP